MNPIERDVNNIRSKSNLLNCYLYFSTTCPPPDSPSPSYGEETRGEGGHVPLLDAHTHIQGSTSPTRVHGYALFMSAPILPSADKRQKNMPRVEK